MSLTFTAAVRANKPKRNVGIIDAGNKYSLAIQKNGRAWGWGYNFYNTIGDNTGSARCTPVSVAGAVKTFCKISGGDRHSLAIDKNGMVWAWGDNFYGKLGDNTNVLKKTPVSVLGTVKTFCKIYAAVNNSHAIDKNGMVWGWGEGYYGQIGDGTNPLSQLTPVSVGGAKKTFCEIATGLAIDKYGRAWGWGRNQYGEVGDNTTTRRLTPVSVLGAIKTFCKISGGSGNSLAIDKNGMVWGWGANYGGALGDNTTTQRLTPVSVAGAVKTFCQISAGINYSLAIDKNGRAWAWGYNLNGQLGDNTTTPKSTPVSVAGATKTFCEIHAGNNHSLAIDKNGRAWGWGTQYSGMLGNGVSSAMATPVSVLGTIKTFCKIEGDGYSGHYAMGIDKNGRAWGWGNNYNGQIGDNTTVSKFTPVSVAGAVKTFCTIVANQNSTLGLDKNGRAWGWGRNYNGQIGDNTTTQRLTPVSVLGAVKTFCKIAAGFISAHAIDKNGMAWGWGGNVRGQIGDNTTTQRLTPVSVLGAVKTFCKIAAGGYSCHAIDKNGMAWGWGLNSTGQIGDNTTVSKLTPVSVAGATKTFCEIYATKGQIQGRLNYISVTFALDKYGRAWAWGYNIFGQVGDNSTTIRNTPVSVAGAVKTFCKIAGGVQHVLALDKNGRAWGWGRNTAGEIGDGTTESRLTPVSVAGAIKTFCEIGGGSLLSVAIDKNGRSWVWGSVVNATVGISFVGSTTTPVRICNI